MLSGNKVALRKAGSSPTVGTVRGMPVSFGTAVVARDSRACPFPTSLGHICHFLTELVREVFVRLPLVFLGVQQHVSVGGWVGSRSDLAKEWGNNAHQPPGNL